MVIHDQKVLLASAARTATATGDWNTNLGHKGANFVLKSTASAATPSVVLTVEGLAASGATYTVATAAAVTDGSTTRVLQLYPGITDQTDPDGAGFDPVANKFAGVLPPQWRYVVTAADSDSITYSLAVDLLP